MTSNISFVNGKAEYEKQYKTVTDEENEKIAKQYAIKLRERQKEKEAGKKPTLTKKSTSLNIQEYNLLKKLNIKEEDKTILFDAIKYVLTDRQKEILKEYFEPALLSSKIWKILEFLYIRRNCYNTRHFLK